MYTKINVLGLAAVTFFVGGITGALVWEYLRLENRFSSLLGFGLTMVCITVFTVAIFSSTSNERGVTKKIEE
ncbi:hypothetical protein KC722_02230 [Candidatus Kaiserbacteria bacterium]|nr:hypothetical protein [Candidatus Kaiserbacteria bacterium]MCB9811767.1 hypothetical protein [Candidatus Nomurabacteria bacterium]